MANSRAIHSHLAPLHWPWSTNWRPAEKPACELVRCQFILEILGSFLIRFEYVTLVVLQQLRCSPISLPALSPQAFVFILSCFPGLFILLAVSKPLTDGLSAIQVAQTVLWHREGSTGKRTQTETLETLFYCEGDLHLHRLPTEAVGSPSLEIIKTWLGMAVNKIAWAEELDWVISRGSSSLAHPVILWSLQNLKLDDSVSSVSIIRNRIKTSHND